MLDEKKLLYLENLYQQYSKSYSNDPIKFPHQYRNEIDIEVVGFIASALAHGKVELFMNVVSKILERMGNSPADYLLNFNFEKEKDRFAGVYYRYNNNEIDILILLYCLSETIKKWKSLKNLFLSSFKETRNIKFALTQFADEIRSFKELSPYFKDLSPRFYYLLPYPQKGSACKRLNLFLRWMVRDKDIDFGIWKEVGKENLIIPLDTHVAKISRCLGLLKRKSNDWKAAEELTTSLKQFDPHDPIKYDFALCHIGIDGVCNTRNCENCNIIT